MSGQNIKADGPSTPTRFYEGSLELIRVEIIASVGVYQPKGKDSLTNYCVFATDVVTQFKKPIYLTLDQIKVFFIEEETKWHAVEKFLRGRS